MDRRLSKGDTVLVLTEHWLGQGTHIRWFPDDPCLDRGTSLHMLRSRLGNPRDIGTIADCKYGAPYEVTRCTVI